MPPLFTKAILLRKSTRRAKRAGGNLRFGIAVKAESSIKRSTRRAKRAGERLGFRACPKPNSLSSWWGTRTLEPQGMRLVGPQWWVVVAGRHFGRRLRGGPQAPDKSRHFGRRLGEARIGSTCNPPPIFAKLRHPQYCPSTAILVLDLSTDISVL